MIEQTWSAALLLSAASILGCTDLVGADFGGARVGTCSVGESRPCYEGPVGTEGVGLCRAGTETCGPDGTTWGPCTGAVGPATENGDARGDESCDGLSGDAIWTRTFGDAGSQVVRDVAVDPSGAVVLAGGLAGTVDFGGDPHAGKGGLDACVAKLDAAGEHVFSRCFGSPSSESFQCLAIDPSDGSIVLGAGVVDPVDFGGGGPEPVGDSGWYKLVLVKLASDGSSSWSRPLASAFGDDPASTCGGIAIAPDGSIAIAGQFRGPMSIVDGPPLTNVADEDTFVAKLSPDGEHVWSRSFGGLGGDLVYGVALSPDGDVVVTGTTDVAVDVGGGDPTQGGYLAAYARGDGAHVWSRSLGSRPPLPGLPHQLVATPGGGFVVTTVTDDNLDLGGGALPATGGLDVVVARFGPEGEHVLSRRFGTAGDQLGLAIAVDAFDDVLLAGAFSGAIDFGLGPLVEAGTPGAFHNDAFLVKLDRDGVPLWDRQFGDADDAGTDVDLVDRLVAVALDADGNAIVVGRWDGTVDWGEGPVASKESADLVVGKYAP